MRPRYVRAWVGWRSERSRATRVWQALGIAVAVAVVAWIAWSTVERAVANDARRSVVEGLRIPDGWTLVEESTRGAGTDGPLSGFDVRPLNSTWLRFAVDDLPATADELEALLPEVTWTLSSGTYPYGPPPARCDRVPSDPPVVYVYPCLARTEIDGFEVDVQVGGDISDEDTLEDTEAIIMVAPVGEGYRPSTRRD